ncbi:non-ribosomal peptide synthetase NpsA [Lactobacillus plantarum WCFS1] [Lactiplantibacillus mudanjiangensis]|uniref:non-ribosomal peptide synthetase n=1 Tax=Lactiplantibacillus mudanjiangensis TaxID=1296538 RepID=UPI0010158CA7|nr:non-ribosomal peptide synthetase NpsA [Lactobacillus plantarum WCFS1] [Lactiplantibacillus mudanjiangensis]
MIETIVANFEAQVKQTPEQIAVVFKKHRLTYMELNQRANRLAHYITKHYQVSGGDIVPLLLDRNENMLVAMLGVLKTGAVYTALSKQYPQSRIDFVQAQTNAKVILTDDIMQRALSESSDEKNLELDINEKDLAYVVYTSGTTGQPKGVLHTHQSVVSHIMSYWQALKLDRTKHYNMLFLVNYVFSVATTQIYGALFNGNTLVISAPNSLENIQNLTDYINQQQINYFQSTPSLANSLDFKQLPSLKMVAVAGEKIPASLFENTSANGIQLTNVYGQSEFHAGTTKLITKVTDIDKVGRVVSGMNAYVVGDNMREVSVGETGEICFAGAQLASGYLNLPTETEQHFVTNPFGDGKLCCTGDLVKRLPNNEYEFVGRKDFQLNINGIRTEPAEIERELTTLPDIQAAVVVGYRNQTLAAYYVSEHELDVAGIKTSLKDKLPQYMQPQVYMWLAKLPLNDNGKLDRRQLPTIKVTEEQFVAPTTASEKLLTKAVAEILKRSQISVIDDFFQLGGNSLQAMQLANHIMQVANKRITAEMIFDNQPLRKLATVLDQTEVQADKSIVSLKQQTSYAMSPAEKRMFILYEFDHNSTDYNEQTVLDCTGRIDTQRLQQALATLIKRHEILRTSFKHQSGQYLQQVMPDNTLDFKTIEATDDFKHLVQPFDLEKGQAMRVRVVHQVAHDAIFIDKHHIITDGTSENVFYDELEKLYRHQSLPDLTVQYKDYSVWFNDLDTSQEKRWWNTELADYQRLELTTDHPWTKNHLAIGRTLKLPFSSHLVKQLHAFARASKTSEYMVLFSTISLLLGKMYHSSDFVLGTVTSGRVEPSTEDMLGMFVNTLPIRVKPNGEVTAAAYLQTIKQTLLKALDNQNYQFEDIVNDLHATSDVGNPLFDCMFVYQNTATMTHDFDGPAMRNDYETDASKFAMTFEVIDADNQMELRLNYDSALFDEQTITNLAQHLFLLTANFMSNLQQSLTMVPAITVNEQKSLLDFPKDRHYSSVVKMFEEQVQQNPQALALQFENKTYTYQELNRAVNQVANYLLTIKKVHQEQKLPLLLRRTDKMVIAILAVLKAGAAYVPMSLKYPQERIDFIKTACEADFIIDDSFMDQTFITSDENPNVTIDPNQLAYLIFTSGTSGTPKGVMVKHQNLSNYSVEVGRAEGSGMHPGMINGAFFEYVFDSSIHDLIRPYVMGESVVILDTDLIYDIDRFILTLNHYHVNAIGMTPSLAARIDLTKVPSLEAIYCGGEAITQDAIDKYQKTKIQLSNCYGPTETTVLSFMNNQVSDMSIGRPIGGVHAYVLDDQRQLLPAGAVGNLYIGGPQVTRGYLNRPEETAKHYVENPFGKGTIYDTGDLVRKLNNGTYAYFGRKDFQVKIRGYRVELGEVENKLQAIAGVQQAKVIVHNDNLVAYYVSQREESSDDLYDALSKSLPDYMLPTTYMHMLSFPLTINGKLDTRALPEPIRHDKYVAPSNKREQDIEQAFCKVLKLDRVSVNANFFRLGGNSIAAISLANEIDIPVKTIFECKTIASLAKQTEKIQTVTKQHFEHVEDQKLSYAQERLFFINELEEGTSAYNIPMLLTLKPNVDQDKLIKAIQMVVRRHEVLRTIIVDDHQEVLDQDVVITHDSIDVASYFAYQFKLGKEIPIRVNVHDHQVAINVHHIAFDGWSTDIFLQEVVRLYAGEHLEPLTVQYKDFAKWQIDNQDEAYLKSQADYWAKELTGYKPVNFPTDYVRPKQFDYRGQEYYYKLDTGLIQQINQIAKANDTSFYCVALSAFMLLLSSYSHQNDVVVGTPIANRHIKGTKDLIGFFVNTLAIRTVIDGKESFDDLLSRITNKINLAQANQDLPFEQLVNTLNVEKDLSRNPIFQIMFGIDEGVESFKKNVLFESLNKDLALNETKFDFSVMFHGNGLNFTFATSLFSLETIQNIAKTYELILKQVANNTELKLGQLQLNGHKPTKTAAKYPSSTIVSLFEAEVTKHPDHKAVIFKNYSITYKELNKAANQIAHSLIDSGIKPGMHIPILLKRNERFVITILGILKAGANYVPLSLDYPEERINYILGKLGSNFIIDDTFKVSSTNISNPNLGIKPSDLAYIIFTSGTTGKPKGVMIKHDGVINTIYNQIDLFNLTSATKMVHFADFVFDASAYELFCGLLSGASIYLLDDTTRLDYQLLQSVIQKNQIELAVLPPAILNPDKLLPLKTLVVAGESTPLSIYEAYYKAGTKIVNAYGPTETTVCATVKFYRPNMNVNNIGRVLDNMSAYVLNENDQQVPQGAIGELCVGGPGLAVGYLDDEVKTNKAFIVHPKFGRIYKTGDLVRQLSNGEFIYIGRNDSQVKVRGFRIELGEIESKLMRQSTIDQCLAMVRGTNIVAYYTGTLSKTLEDELPSYMVPNSYVKLDEFPITINGKTDLRKLPEPAIERKQFVLPNTVREKEVAQVICKLLSISQVSMTDDFYELGGNSILALKLATKLDLQVKQIYQAKSIQDIAKFSTKNLSVNKQQFDSEKDQVLSFAQERLWFVERFEDKLNAYNVPISLDLIEDVSVPRLEKALQLIVQRHEVLRTIIKDNYQIVTNQNLIITHDRIDLNEYIEKPFDLGREIPIRANLYHKKLVVNIDHLAFDGWSTDIFLRELNELYNGKSLASLNVQYKDFAKWQRDYVKTEPVQKQLTYWKNYLADYDALNLPADYERPKNFTYRGNTLLVPLNENLKQQLIKFAKDHKTSLYTVMLSVLDLMLSRFSYQKDIIVGTPLANRNIEGLEDLIGFFINTLPVRTNVDEHQTFNELVSQNHATVQGVQNNQDIPFEQVVKAMNVEQDPSRNAVFQVLFSVQDFSTQLMTQSKLFTGLNRDLISHSAKYDLSVMIENGYISFNYCTDIYKQSTVQSMLMTYLELLNAVIERANAPMQYLDKVDTKAQGQKINYPQQTVVDLFEQQVAKTPDNIAIEYQDAKLTYREFDQRTNQVANYLLSKGITPGDKVPIMLERSEKMSLAIWGVLKAGCAYVPVSPEFPDERKQYILQQLNAKLIIDEHFDVPVETPSTNLEMRPKLSDLAYLIFTSGTTGKPKGVMIEHAGLSNRVQWMNETYPLTVHDKVYQKTNFVFDVSVWEQTWALLTGARIVFAREGGHKDPVYLANEIKAKQITVMHFVPSMLDAFLETLKVYQDDANQPDFDVSSLKYVFCSGEALNIASVKQFHELLPTTQLFNLYGPTEASIDVTYADCNQPDMTKVLIGRPVANTDCYVLSQTDELVPVGAIGELALRGIQLARGYINQPKLTAQKFMQHPTLGRIYKTGDLVRLLPDGELEYLGRNDMQVKIRGLRIELGEIETRLTEVEGIKKAIVMAINKRLVAYYVADQAVNEEVIKHYLTDTLPDYMMPNAYVYMTKLPFTINGKLDRRALPVPTFTDEEFVAPASPNERHLQKIIADVLDIEAENVSVTASFFHLGGDSIKAIQLSNRIEQQQHQTVTIKQIFDAKTIRNLARLLDKQQAQATILHERGPLTGEVPLLPVQEWFFDEVQSMQFNQAFAIKLPVDCDLDHLKQALITLVNYHDALRLHFTEGHQSYGQPVDTIKLYQAQSVNDYNRIQAGFKLDDTALYRFVWNANDTTLAIICHHLIVDTVSWQILIGDLKTLYYGGQLPAKGTSYRQWAKVSQKNLSDFDPVELHGFNDKFKVTHTLQTRTVALNKQLTVQLLKQVNRVYHTQVNDVLLTALARALKSVIGEDTSYVKLESHGRAEIADNINIHRTVGWFTAIYPQQIETDLTATKQLTHQVKDYGIGYGERYGLHDQDLPGITFNYLGQLDNGVESEWSLVSRDLGTESTAKLHDFLTINGGVINQKLTFTVTGNMVGLDRVATQYEADLSELITTLANNKRTYLTSDDVQNIVTQSQLDQLQADQELVTVVPANSLQAGFVYQALNNESHDDAYICSYIFDYGQVVDVDKYRQAWAKAQEKYPSLRLALNADYETILQVVPKQGRLDFKLETTASVDEVVKAERLVPFDLSKGNLFRIRLVKRDEQHYTCVLTNHHAISDGWSNPVLLNFVHTMYAKLCHGESITVNQDQAYITSQKYLANTAHDADRYWKTYLGNVSHPDLAGLFKAESHAIKLEEVKRITQPRNQSYKIDGQLYQQLQAFSKQQGLTVNIIAQYAWHKLLSVYGGVQNTTIGVVNAGRNLPVDGIEDSVGLYIRTLPIQFNHTDETPIEQLHHLQDINNDCMMHNNVSLASLQPNGTRLFDTLFVYENYPITDDRAEADDLQLRNFRAQEKLDYPLTIMLDEANGRLNIQLKYAGEIFSDVVIDQLFDFMKRLIEQMTSGVKQFTYVDQIPSFGIDYYPKDTIVSVFEQQVMAHPERIALNFGDLHYRFDELNAKANQVAHTLVTKYDIKPGDRIPLLLPKTEKTIVAILAILKAGGTYVPMAMTFPHERIKYITEKVAAKLTVDETFMAQTFSDDTSNLNVEITPNTLAYIIFTSGTTGRPKGVMVEHRNFIIYLKDIIAAIKRTGTDDIDFGCIAEYVFDIFGTETLGQLLRGKAINLFAGAPEEFPQFMATHHVTALQSTPGKISYMFQDNDQAILATDLTTIMVGGEKMNEAFAKRFTSINLINIYGPTEGTVWTSMKRVTDNYSNIGQPFPNYTHLILDQHQRLLPQGAVGELYVSGPQLSRGYYGQPELTKKAFLDNPYNDTGLKEYSRLYKTGDIVRVLPNHEFELIGRNDFQVKIRGFRIELGEIESAMLRVPGIKQVLALALGKAGSKYLGVYYVSDQEIARVDIEKVISQYLTDYMMPAGYQHVTEFPLTINGKIDRRVLPEIAYDNDVKYVAPKNAVEQLVQQQICDLLGLDVEKVSMLESFFAIGGDSIKVIKLISMLKLTFNKKLTIKSIFDAKTIQAIAEAVQTEQSQTKTPHLQVTKQNFETPQTQVLSEAQIEDQQQVANSYTNVKMAFKLQPGVDEKQLTTAVIKEVQRQTVLRTKVFETYQLVDETGLVVTHEAINRNQYFAHVFDLQHEIPIKVNIYDGEFTCVIDHIAFDGWSTAIFLEEIQAFYDGKSLPQLPYEYRDFAKCQREFLNSSQSQTQLEYWQNEFKDFEELRLPMDSVNGVGAKAGSDVYLNLDDTFYAKLLHVVKVKETTVHNVLLSAYYLMLAKISGQQSISIAIPTVDRNVQGVEQLVGLFINQFLLTIKLNPDQTVGQLIKTINDKLIAAQNNQDVPLKQVLDYLEMPITGNKAYFGIQGFKGEALKQSSLFTAISDMNQQVEKDAFTDLAIFVWGQTIDLNYAKALFKPETVQQFANDYRTILEQMVENMDTKIWDLTEEKSNVN